jgi:two-component system, NarL family, invasion response regulator UvrY
MIQVLFVEDHAIVREGLKQILADTDDIVMADEAINGEEALDKVVKKDFDVVVLDISMPGRSGLEVLKELKCFVPKLPVLILSMYPEELYAIRAFKCGAAGYLSKESAPTELITAIRRVASGGKYISTALAENLAVNLSDDNNPPHAKLSERENQIFSMIAAGKAGKEIAAELKLSAKTVSTYRARVLEKMGMKTNAELTHYALQNKLVF